MSYRPEGEGLPGNWTVPFKARIDDINDGVAYLVVTSAKGTHHITAIASWFLERGFNKGERFKCDIVGGEVVYEKIPLPEFTTEELKQLDRIAITNIWKKNDWL